MGRVIHDIDADGPLIARARDNVGDHPAGLQFKRGQAGTFPQHFGAQLLKVGERSSALAGEHPEHFSGVKRLAELELEGFSRRQRRRTGGRARLGGGNSGPPPDARQTQGQRQQSRQPRRPVEPLAPLRDLRSALRKHVHKPPKLQSTKS